jgi:hypothetical protein
MASNQIWIVIGFLAIVTTSISLAESDPGYSKYRHLYANSQKEYSGHRRAILTKPYRNPYYRSLGESYRSLPSRRGKSYLHLPTRYGGYSNQPYYNEHFKYLRGSKKPHFSHRAKHSRYPHHTDVPKPHPITHPKPHPVPHPHPHPLPHPTTHPYPVPHPHPIPTPHPNPKPIPHPIPSPIPIPHPQPHPAPAPVLPHLPVLPPRPSPEEVPTEHITIPQIVNPGPPFEIPDIDFFPDETIPIRPIETIGRPPVAPSVKPPTFIEFQRSVPGFVDIQRVNIHPHGHPMIANFVPEQRIPIVRFPTENNIADNFPQPHEIQPESAQPLTPIFLVQEAVSPEVRRVIKPVPETDFQDFIAVGNFPQPHELQREPVRPLTPVFPVQEAISRDLTRVTNPVPETNFRDFPVLGNFPQLHEIEREPARPLRPVFPVQGAVSAEVTRVTNAVPEANFQDFPVLDNFPRPHEIEREPTRPSRPVFPVRESVSAEVTNSVPGRNFQDFPTTNDATIPLLSRAVPAVPISNPQPRFKTVSTSTAQAIALLLQTSRPGVARAPISAPVQTSESVQRFPAQQTSLGISQIDFRRLPTVVLPEPVPAVPLTQP